MLIDIYLKVEEEVVFCGGAVGKSGEVSTKSSIEDLLSKNLVQEYKQGYENKKMWMGDFLKKGSDSLFFYSPTHIGSIENLRLFLHKFLRKNL